MRKMVIKHLKTFPISWTIICLTAENHQTARCESKFYRNSLIDHSDLGPIYRYGGLIAVSTNTLLNWLDQIIVNAIYMYFTKYKLKLNVVIEVVSCFTKGRQILLGFRSYLSKQLPNGLQMINLRYYIQKIFKGYILLPLVSLFRIR